MPKKIKNQKKTTEGFRNEHIDLLHEVIMVCILAVGFILAVSVYTEQAGAIGSFLQRVNLGLLGFGAYLLPVMIIVYSVLVLFRKMPNSHKWKIYIVLGFLIIVSTFVHVLNAMDPINGFVTHTKHYYEIGAWSNGGVVGGVLGDLLLKTVGTYGTYIMLFALSIVCFVLLTERSFIKDMITLGKLINNLFTKLIDGLKTYKEKNQEITNNIHKGQKTIIKPKQKLEEPSKAPEVRQTEEEDKPIKIMDFMQTPVPNQNAAVPKEEVQKESTAESNEKKESNTEASIENLSTMSTKVEYTYPALDLLQPNTVKATGSSKNQILQNAKKLETTLESFGVSAKVLQVSRGPTVTRYELQPSQGVKVSKIVNLADDIALNLAAAGIRIEAPIPGKAAVGIEVPNTEVQSVFLREVVEDENFQKFPSKLAFALGKDISGNVVVTDIAKMPHLLIAGATGSGKSVCINTLITSIIYKANPNEVKLLMVDPKVVELSVYNGIPHLMIPVVTDPKKAASALNWAVQEMIQRYKLFAENNVRDIKGYNNMKDEKQEEDKMPQIVIIIDELADLMMAAPGDVEDAICRLAQMARAAGIHLVIATQRPSVDVITGVIKANIPSRLAFAVSSGTDSRTILDMNGAEKLLGKGDMLFYPVGASKPIRIQGAFISDKEVESIVDFVKKGEEVEYNEEIIDEITAVKSMPDAREEEVDEYLSQAIELVIDKEKASISMLQRSFRIGFNRAARIMEELETRGIVGPDEGSKPRKVMISKEELEEMKQEA